ncbi:MAG: GntR family transcriptional regulator [Hyphomicrobiales bacterium]
MRPIERPRSLTATVVDRLRQSIVQGDLALGQFLSERQLAEHLGVSKTPVREALTQLKHEGLVRVIPQRGAEVFTLSAREVINMCELRLTLEAAALKLAWQRHPDALVRGLRAVLAKMEASRAQRNMRAYLNADTAYHEVFFETCGNPLLAQSYANYLGKIAALRTHLSVKPFHTERSFEEHRDMLACLEAGRIENALEILDRHIARSKTTYAETVEDIAAADNTVEASR